MLECFYPKEYLDSTYQIDFEKLYRQGYRELFLILTIRWCRMGFRQMSAQWHCFGG